MGLGALTSMIVVLLIVAPATAGAATACRDRDVREMLREAGQGFNGRVVEVHEDRLVVVVESQYDERTIAFGEEVTVYGRSLPASQQGRIGLVVRRQNDRWQATPCDVVPGARIARALSGLDPCPAPGVTIVAVTKKGRTVRMSLRLLGDVTRLRLQWGRTVRQRSFQPGVVSLVERHRFPTAGRHRVVVRAYGASGPGCGTPGQWSASKRRTVRIS